MRKSADISQASAAHVAKHRIKEILTDGVLPDGKALPTLQAWGLKMSLADNGGVDQIADILYRLGLKLSIDMNNPTHAAWVKDGVVELE